MQMSKQPCEVVALVQMRHDDVPLMRPPESGMHATIARGCTAGLTTIASAHRLTNQSRHLHKRAASSANHVYLAGSVRVVEQGWEVLCASQCRILQRVW